MNGASQRHRWILWVGLADVGAVLLGVLLFILDPIIIRSNQGVLFISASVALVGIITYFGSLYGLKGSTTEERTRIAVASAMVVTYLVLVGLTAFYKSQDTSALASTMLTSFTASISVVLAFFFGSSAYVQTRSQGQQERGSSTTAGG